MSLAIGLTGRDGVVLAADSRGTVGDPRGLTAINDTMQKLFQLNKVVGCCTFGSAEMGLAVLTDFRGEVSNADVDDLYVESIVQSFSRVARQSYAAWFSNTPPNERPGLGIIIGGLNEAGEPKVYFMGHTYEFAPMPAPAGFHFGGVVNYAIYLAHRFYDRKISISDLRRLAEYLIYETSTQDPKVGGPIDIATIAEDGTYYELSGEEGKALRDANETLSAQLQDFFYKEGKHEDQ